MACVAGEKKGLVMLMQNANIPSRHVSLSSVGNAGQRSIRSQKAALSPVSLCSLLKHEQCIVSSPAKDGIATWTVLSKSGIFSIMYSSIVESLNPVYPIPILCAIDTYHVNIAAAAGEQLCWSS